METIEETDSETQRTTFSAPRELMERARERARVEQRNFSNYISWLISRDLEKAEKADKEAKPAKCNE